MTELLQQPPRTSDPITWIAFLLVTAMVAVLLWQLRAAREERKEERSARQESLAAFRAELSAHREHDERLVAETHRRIDVVAERVQNVHTAVAGMKS